MENFEQREERIFQKSLELPPEERGAFVNSACAGDAELKDSVLSLLHSHETVGGFLESLPAADSATVAKRLERIAPSEESPGDQIGRYRLLELIGEGSWGSVWMAQQTEDINRRVALKILKLGLDTREFLARFEAERQMMAMMDHPNIGRVLDAGATDFGRPYLVMELVRGLPLIEYVDKKRLTIEDRVKLFIKICHAAQHAHQKGIIHRDLKPSNILVSEQDGEPVPKIIDFGVAKTTQFRVTDKTLFTGTRTFLGTPVYCSPEQLLCTGQDVDYRSDLYSLGALLYELLCGLTPFNHQHLSAMGLDAMKTLISQKDPPRPSLRLGDVSPEKQEQIALARRLPVGKVGTLLKGDLDWTVMKCLEKDPKRRYASADALGKDLEAYLQGNPVSAVAPSALYHTRKFIARKRPAYAIWLELTAVLLAIIAVYSFLRPRPAGPPPVEFELTQQVADNSGEPAFIEKSIAVLPFQNFSPDPDNTFFADGVHSDLLARLANINDLVVIGRQSTLVYRDTLKTDRQIGQELAVNYLVQGFVQRLETEIHLNIHLIHSSTGRQLMARTYDGTLDDLFSMQSEIAQEIVAELNAVLSPEELREIERPPTDNPEAFDLYLRSAQASKDEKKTLLEKAVERDPDFYDAWSDLAWSRVIDWRFKSHRNDPELLESAYDALNQMKRLAPESRLTLNREATFAFHVEDDIQKALTLHLRARSLGLSGGDVGLRYLQLGHLEQARYEFEATLRSDPLNATIADRLSWVYVYLGMWDDAQALLENFLEKSENEERKAGLNHSMALIDYLKTGDLESYRPARIAFPGNYDETQIKLWENLSSRDFQSALQHIEEIDFYWFQMIGNPGPTWNTGMGFKPLDLLSALIRFELGDREKCLQEVEKAKAFFASIDSASAQNIPPDSASLLAICYALEGNRERMESLITLVREKTKTENWQFREQAYTEMHFAICHLVLGDHNGALEILEAASKMKTPIFLHRELELWFIFDRLQGNPRFDALLRKDHDILKEAESLASSPISSPSSLEPLSRRSDMQADRSSSLVFTDKSIAVLPLDNLSPDPDNGYFADGIHEEILTNLSRIDDLLVIARTSTLQYRNAVKPIRQIGNELGVRYIIEGSVRRDADQVRVDIRLTDAQTGGQLWVERYNSNLDDIFAIQSAIARNIAARLETTLTPEVIAEIEQRPTRNAAAYDFFLKARRLIRSGPSHGDEKIALLEQAVSSDPEFVDAWAQLAIECIYWWDTNKHRQDPVLQKKARQAMDRALVLDPERASVQFARGIMAYRENHDYDLFIDQMLLVLGITPNFEQALLHLSRSYLWLGRLIEARRYGEQTVRLDPLLVRGNKLLLDAYFSLGLWENARGLIRENQSRDPDGIQWHRHLAECNYLETGDLVSYLDSIESISGFIESSRGQLWGALQARDFEAALPLFETVNPENSLLGFVGSDNSLLQVEQWDLLRALVLFEMGDLEAAAKQARTARKRLETLPLEDPLFPPDYLSRLAICYALEGDQDSMMSLVPQIRQRASLKNNHFQYWVRCEVQIAIANLVLGHEGKTLEILEATGRHENPNFLRHQLPLLFIFDRLKGNPRFEALLRGEVFHPSPLVPRPSPPGHKESNKSIAILPFENLGGSEEEATFTDGFHSELTTNISGIPDLRTIARLSTLVYRDSVKSLAEIGQELGAAKLVSGTVRWAGDRLRVTVELADAASGEVLWSKPYSEKRSVRDIFDIQIDICQAVADELEVLLSPDRYQFPTDNLRAYEAYLKGREIVELDRVSQRPEAISFLEEAIRLDLEFGLAYQWLAQAQLVYLPVSQQGQSSWEERTATAESLARRAIELEPRSASAYSTLGIILARSRQEEEARQAFELSLQLNPNEALAYLGLADLEEIRMDFRDARMIERIHLNMEKAVRIDPNNYEYRRRLGGLLRQLGQFSEAKAELERAVELQPGSALANKDLGHFYAWCLGRFDLGMVYQRKVVSLDPERWLNAHTLFEYFIQLGDLEEIQRWVDLVMKMNDGFRDEYQVFYLAQTYPDAEERWLEDYRKVVREHPAWPARRMLFQADLAAGRIEEARAFYEEYYPSLFEEELNIYGESGLRAFDIKDRAKAAVEVAEIERRSGNVERAVKLADEAWEVWCHLPRMGWRWNNSTGFGIYDAVIHAIKGENEMAIASLRKAVEAGFRIRLEFDLPFFDSIREDPEFIELVEIVEQDLAEQLANIHRMEANRELAQIPDAIRSKMLTR